MNQEPYRLLANRLDSLPNGFPATDDGTELNLLATIFSPEDAALAAKLRLTRETAEQIADRIGAAPEPLRHQLKGMARRGLISAGRTKAGFGFGLMPFVVGIYEMQAGTLDAEMAALFESYYQKQFGQALEIEPPVHRVIPVGESVRMDLEIRPFESAAEIVDGAQSWGVLDCICRKQKALIGDPCAHPVDVCMALSQQPGAFEHGTFIRDLTKDEAMATLDRAARAGLVHSVSNNQEGLWYICNCCTCSCAILRGIAELGIANAVARSQFVNQVDDSLCLLCGDCVEHCQFDALTVDDACLINQIKCVGCGVCVGFCPEEALGLIQRPMEEIVPIPTTMADWMTQRAEARHLDLADVL
jgi:electron transport complex protein RnfB